MMPKKKLISIFSIILSVVLLFATSAFSVQQQNIGVFNNAGKLIEWINTVDLETIDDAYNDFSEALTLKSLVESIRNDDEILIPKYKGQDFSCKEREQNQDQNPCIIVVPEFALSNGRFILFSDEYTELRLAIHRIDDKDLKTAKEDYKKYFAEQYDYIDIVIDSFGLMNGESAGYKKIDKYNVIVSIHNYNGSAANYEDIFKDLSFVKTKLSDPSIIIETYSFDDYLTPSVNYEQVGKDVYLSFVFSGGKYLLGDVNMDDKITASDARTTLRTTAKLEKNTWREKVIMDVNYDGKITAVDARSILRVSAKHHIFKTDR